MDINIIRITGTNGTYVGDRGEEKYLAIHYTAGVTSRKGSARNTAEYFKTASGTADFIVDDEEIVQYNRIRINILAGPWAGMRTETKEGDFTGLRTITTVSL